MGERLKDKVAIVTGAGSVLPGMGNGKATAIVFAREGAKVMAVDYNLEAAEETKKMIDEEGGECITFQADVSKASDCQKMVETCIQKFGRIDILHNNVGIGQWGGVIETAEETWDKVMAVNVKSMFLTGKYAIPQMLKQGGGSITNIASVGAIRFTLPNCAYASSKSAIIALTRDIALEYADKGIRCNVILPGLMKTPQAEYYNKDAWACGAAATLCPPWAGRVRAGTPPMLPSSLTPTRRSTSPEPAWWSMAVSRRPSGRGDQVSHF
jgi:NAD(P)-dependent dehydrogenase (short-subunit alcohol dehydrogenase family)